MTFSCSWCKMTGMTDNYLDPDKYDFDNEQLDCECDGEHACDCVYDPELDRMVQRGHAFDVEQDEE